MAVETEQKRKPLIERCYRVKIPSGRVLEVNRFDYNLAFAAGDNSYIQCSDSSWCRVNNLTIIEGSKG